MPCKHCQLCSLVKILRSPCRANTLLTDDEVSLVNEFGFEGARAEELLAYDDDDDLDEEWSGCQPDNVALASHSMDYNEIQVRVDATNRAQANRRPGGLRTQIAMVRAWEVRSCVPPSFFVFTLHQEFIDMAVAANKVRDHVVDEHSLLLFISFCAERPKRTRKGLDIPGTFIGAVCILHSFQPSHMPITSLSQSHLKKLFFGALRIRKEQDAANPLLARKRPATTVIVWDAIKNRMDEALERIRKYVKYIHILLPSHHFSVA